MGPHAMEEIEMAGQLQDVLFGIVRIVRSLLSRGLNSTHVLKMHHILI